MAQQNALISCEKNVYECRLRNDNGHKDVRLFHSKRFKNDEIKLHFNLAWHRIVVKSKKNEKKNERNKEQLFGAGLETNARATTRNCQLLELNRIEHRTRNWSHAVTMNKCYYTYNIQTFVVPLFSSSSLFSIFFFHNLKRIASEKYIHKINDCLTLSFPWISISPHDEH